MVVSLVRPKSCPSGGGSAFLENGYGIERDITDGALRMVRSSLRRPTPREDETQLTLAPGAHRHRKAAGATVVMHYVKGWTDRSDHLAPAFATPTRYQYRTEERRSIA
jgi:hypothetical protein